MNNSIEYQNNLEQFTNKMINALKDYYGEDYSVKSGMVTKNNDMVLHSITVFTKDRNVAPTIYAEPFFDEYEDGKPFSDIIKSIIDLYDRTADYVPFNPADLDEYDKVRPMLIMKLINRNMNESYLTNVPYISVCDDLALVFAILTQDEQIGMGTVLIHGDMLANWNIDIDRLYSDARENMKNIVPAVLQGLKEILCDKMGGNIDADELPDTSMLVLTTRNSLNGAAALFYDGMLEEISESVGGDYYIIPSSIYELIIVPASDETVREEALNEMIREVNSTHMRPEEILSDHAYRYNASGKMMVAV